MADAVWDSSRGEGLVIPDLLRGWVLRILSIAAGPESEGFGVEYEEVPALERPQGDVGGERTTKRAAGNWWGLTGRDDVGTEYDAPSGAVGPSPSGAGTRGVLDVYPSPPAEAAWVDLTFEGGRTGRRSGQYRFVLRVSLPLRVLTYEEIAAEKGMSEAELLTMLEVARQLQALADEEAAREAEE